VRDRGGTGETPKRGAASGDQGAAVGGSIDAGGGRLAGSCDRLLEHEEGRCRVEQERQERTTHRRESTVGVLTREAESRKDAVIHTFNRDLCTPGVAWPVWASGVAEWRRGVVSRSGCAEWVAAAYPARRRRVDGRYRHLYTSPLAAPLAARLPSPVSPASGATNE
jgi:hypothetical protein